MVAYTVIPALQEVEAGRSGVQGQPQLSTELEASLVLVVYSCRSARKRHEECLGPEA